MNRKEHLLVIAMEECAEIAKELSKALRFGLDDFHPKYDNIPNKEKIRVEFNDLLAIFSMLDSEGFIDIREDDTAISTKIDKIERYLLYSKERGTLTNE